MAAAALLLLWATPHSSAATFTVTKAEDTADGACDADCSLREAITAANTLAGADIITVPPGAYTLTITNIGEGEDANATGDLDITSDLTINGAGAATTIIQACDSGAGPCTGIDRVFESFFSIVTLSGVTVRNGFDPPLSASGVNTTDGGGIANRGGTLTLTNSTVSGNSTGPNNRPPQR